MSVTSIRAILSKKLVSVEDVNDPSCGCFVIMEIQDKDQNREYIRFTAHEASVLGSALLLHSAKNLLSVQRNNSEKEP